MITTIIIWLSALLVPHAPLFAHEVAEESPLPEPLPDDASLPERPLAGAEKNSSQNRAWKLAKCGFL